MLLKKIKENILNYKVEKIGNKIANTNEAIVTEYNIKCFRIVKGTVIKLTPDIFNGAFNSNNKRMYLKSMFSSNPKGFVSYLKELSHDVEAIQLEFDTYNDCNNVEIEFYLDNSNELKDNHLNLEENCSSVSLNNNFYNEVIKELLV